MAPPLLGASRTALERAPEYLTWARRAPWSSACAFRSKWCAERNCCTCGGPSRGRLFCKQQSVASRYQRAERRWASRIEISLPAEVRRPNTATDYWLLATVLLHCDVRGHNAESYAAIDSVDERARLPRKLCQQRAGSSERLGLLPGVWHPATAGRNPRGSP